MTSAAPLRTLEVRHLQLARAFFAALAAVMITFSPDHSAAVGLAVFSGFAIATGLMWFGLDPDTWAMIAAMYIGGQSVIDVAKVWKGM